MNGIDVSNWNRAIDWEKVKDSGIEAAYIKASEGATFVDSYRKSNYEGAVKAGIKAGFYHFLTGGSSPESQAQNFYRSIYGMKSILLPCLDIEISGFNINDYALRFMAKFKELSGLDMVIYSGAYFARDKFNITIKSKCPLWVAHYTGKPWSTNIATGFSKVIGHQYTDRGRVNGINGNCDMNVFNDEIIIGSISSESGNVNAPSSKDRKIEAGKKYVGERCRELQMNLNLLGYDCGAVDGIFGEKTYNALIKFQGDNGLVKDGLAGVLTFSKMEELLKDRVSKPGWVKKLQKELNIQGFADPKLILDGIAGPKTLGACPIIKRGASGGITKLLQEALYIKADGIFGAETERAVKGFQIKKGLYADGIVGVKTWKMILGL